MSPTKRPRKRVDNKKPKEVKRPSVASKRKVRPPEPVGASSADVEPDDQPANLQPSPVDSGALGKAMGASVAPQVVNNLAANDSVVDNSTVGSSATENPTSNDPTLGINSVEEFSAAQTGPLPIIQPTMDGLPTEGNGAAQEPTAASSATPSPRTKEKAPRSLFRLAAKIFAAMIGLVAIALCITFFIFRFLGGDDVADFQGSWYIDETSKVVEITADQIILAPDAIYDYEIDPQSKTITFSLGDLKGSGHYRFSADRQELAILDGNYSWMDTLLSDAQWSFVNIISHLKGEHPQLFEQGEVSYFSRMDMSSAASSEALSDTPAAPSEGSSDASIASPDALSDAQSQRGEQS